MQEEKCMNERRKDNILEELSCLPILEYAFLKTKDIPFSEQVRQICRQECPRYNRSWSCPPAVGTVEECKERCLKYPECFVFTTAAEPDSFEAALDTRREHEHITDRVTEIFRKYCAGLLVLSSDSCNLCRDCAWPEAPCINPAAMRPCVEGYGIPVPLLAEKAGIAYNAGLAYNAGPETTIWFSLVFFLEDSVKEK